MVSLHPLQVFSTKSSPPSSTLSSMKIKTLIHTLIISHVSRMVRALSKAKTILAQILKENQPVNFILYPKKRKQKQRNIFFGSFRLHYNWCNTSSHVLPVPTTEPHLYYDSTWNSIITTSDDLCNESQLSGYLQWLEDQKVIKENTDGDQENVNEIDQLADMFIATCHEKFRLEKQESYRRFQEMMARSI
ncbi:hypothetical protein JCGZ_25527 [Jatropha curcas]|uniref:DUF761 domain-containing protein n=1 Tax=Jatropha curcas TaxID=180498 RepID=A0A067JKV5_JATCU|nr:uncharacterized protein LOC105646548 [Jatropha curcas]KDP24611.1 hypothetical protein JCGZ_25527 [Jatropha curcas]